MKTYRFFAILFMVLSAGHGFIGTLMARPFWDSGTVWSFSGSLAAWLIAVFHYLHANRPNDNVIGVIAVSATSIWFLLMVWLAEAAQMWTDARIWIWFVNCVVLIAIGISVLIRKPNPPQG